jgi:hypothetical protein
LSKFKLRAGQLGFTGSKERDNGLDAARIIQAQIRVLVRRILRKYGYPPDKQEKATQTVLEQAKLLCAEWAEPVR